MGINVGQAHLDIGDAGRVGGGFRLGEEGGPLGVGGKHDLDQAVLGAGRFLRHLADAGPLRHHDRAGFRREFTGDQLEQRRLAGAVRADESGLGAVDQRHGGIVEQEPGPDPVGEVVDVKHGDGVLPRRSKKGKCDIEKSAARG